MQPQTSGKDTRREWTPGPTTLLLKPGSIHAVQRMIVQYYASMRKARAVHRRGAAAKGKGPQETGQLAVRHVPPTHLWRQACVAVVDATARPDVGPHHGNVSISNGGEKGKLQPLATTHGQLRALDPRWWLARGGHAAILQQRLCFFFFVVAVFSPCLFVLQLRRQAACRAWHPSQPRNRPPL